VVRGDATPAPPCSSGPARGKSPWAPPPPGPGSSSALPSRPARPRGDFLGGAMDQNLVGAAGDRLVTLIDDARLRADPHGERIEARAPLVDGHHLVARSQPVPDLHGPEPLELLVEVDEAVARGGNGADHGGDIVVGARPLPRPTQT